MTARDTTGTERGMATECAPLPSQGLPCSGDSGEILPSSNSVFHHILVIFSAKFFYDSKFQS
jgi:hypothetical protein